MKTNDNLYITGQLIIKKNGIIVVNDPNLVVDTGRYLCAQLIANKAPVISHIKFGDSNVPPVAEDTTLQGNILDSVDLIVHGGDVHEDESVVEFFATRPLGEALSLIAEVGLFNDDDTMLARKSFATINLEATDTLSIFWTLNIK